jgi:ferric-dicitrate binding protein FerR (iron transport regulator)
MLFRGNGNTIMLNLSVRNEALKDDALVTQPRHVSSDVAQAAVEHLLEWQAADEPELAWQKISDWRQMNQQHEQAWQQIERVNEKLGYWQKKLSQVLLTLH